MGIIKKALKKLQCPHKDWETIFNIYGDQINHCGGYRSLRRCRHCGKEEFSFVLDEEFEKTKKANRV